MTYVETRRRSVPVLLTTYNKLTYIESNLQQHYPLL